MAEEDLKNEENGDGEDEEGSTGGKKKLLIIIIAVLVLAGAGAGVFFSGILGGGEEAAGDEQAQESQSDDSGGAPAGAEGELANLPVYYELPEFLVNLSTTGKRVSFLKMKVTLELKDASAVPVVDAAKPRIQDAFNTYLRELRTSDLSGSAGIYRLREELMTRVNKSVEEGLIKDILFSEIIVQ